MNNFFLTCDCILKIGTWNVRGINNDFKKRSVLQEISRENVDIAVLSETKLRQEGTEDYGKYVLFYSGYKIGRANAGIAVLAKKQLCFDIPEPLYINSRIIAVPFLVNSRKVIVIGIYWVDEDKSKKIKNDFEEKVRDVIKRFHHEELIILGDFNARIGTKEVDGIIGDFGNNLSDEIYLKEKNDNGRRLIGICTDFDLKIQNTFFNHDSKHTYSWYCPSNTSRKTLIDYFITKQNSVQHVLDVLLCRWYNCDTVGHESTDHFFLEAIILFPHTSSSCNRDTCNNTCFNYFNLKYDTFLLYHTKFRSMYKNFLHGEMCSYFESKYKTKSTTEIYSDLKKIIFFAAYLTFKNQFMSDSGTFLWDSEMLDTMRKRYANLDLQSLNDSDKLLKPIQKDKTKIWEEICYHLDMMNSKLKKTKNIQNLLNEMHGRNNYTMKPDEFSAACEYYGSFMSEGTRDITHCSNKKFYALHVSSQEVEEILEQLTDDYFPTSDYITINLLKFSCSKTKELLTYLIQRIFNGDELPDKVCEACVSFPKGCFNICDEEVSYHPVMVIMTLILKRRIKMEKCHGNIDHDALLRTSGLAAGFVIRQLLQKNAEINTDVHHLAFVDLNNVVVGIPFLKLFESIKTIFTYSFLSTVKHLYRKNSLNIVSNTHSKKIPNIRGLRRKCLLSLRLISNYIEEGLIDWATETVNMGVSIESRKLCGLWTDDKIVVIAHSHKALVCMVERLAFHMQKLGLNDFTKNVQYLETHDGIYHKGLIFHKNVKMDYDIECRFLEAKNIISDLSTVIRDNSVGIRVKERIFYSIVMQFLLHGCETWIYWAMTKEMKQTINFLETLYWKHHFENQGATYTKLKIKTIGKLIYDELGIIETPSNILESKKMTWKIQILKKSANDWLRCIFEWSPEKTDGKRGGRRKKYDFTDMESKNKINIII